MDTVFINLNKVNLIKIIKISIGCCIAMWLASVFGLKNTASAGVITLLSIQNTKKETLAIAVKRVFAFFLALGLTFACFSLFGFQISSFGIFLFLFVFLCYIGQLEEAIAMNTVLMTHFLIEKSFHFSFIMNEFLILAIGISIGIIINFYMPRKIELIKKDQQLVDSAMQKILEEMSKVIIGKFDHTIDTQLEELEKKLNEAISRAYENMNNTLANDMRYYVEYMEMRLAQCAILHRIHNNLDNIMIIPSQAHIVSRFLKKIASSFHEYNNAIDLLGQLKDMRSLFKLSPLPKTREEFETRAILFQIVNDIEYLLLTKRKFAQSLSDWQIEYFWKNNK